MARVCVMWTPGKMLLGSGEAESESEVTQSCPTLCNPMDCSLPWDVPGKNTGVGCRFFLPGEAEEGLTSALMTARTVVGRGEAAGYGW